MPAALLLFERRSSVAGGRRKQPEALEGHVNKPSHTKPFGCSGEKRAATGSQPGRARCQDARAARTCALLAGNMTVLRRAVAMATQLVLLIVLTATVGRLFVPSAFDTRSVEQLCGHDVLSGFPAPVRVEADAQAVAWRNTSGADKYKDIVVTLITLGDRTCESYDVELALWSAVHNGKWTGMVQIITDHPECVHLHKLGDLLQQTRGVRFTQVPSESEIIMMKRWKTLQFVNAEDFEYSLYMDTDVRVGAPLRPFLDVALAEVNDPLTKSGIAAFCAPYNSTNSRYEDGLARQADRCHTGVLFSARTKSVECMESWRTYFNYSLLLDQQAFDNATDITESDTCRVGPLVPKRWILFPEVDRSLDDFVQDITNSNATFYHLTNTYRRKLAEEKGFIGEYYRILDIPNKIRERKANKTSETTIPATTIGTTIPAVNPRQWIGTPAASRP